MPTCSLQACVPSHGFRDPGHIAALERVLQEVQQKKFITDDKLAISYIWTKVDNIAQLKAFCMKKGFRMSWYYQAADLPFAKWDITHWIAESGDLIFDLCRTPKTDMAYLRHLQHTPALSIRLLKSWCAQQGSHLYTMPAGYSKWTERDRDMAFDRVISIVQRALPRPYTSQLLEWETGNSVYGIDGADNVWEEAEQCASDQGHASCRWVSMLACTYIAV